MSQNDALTKAVSSLFIPNELSNSLKQEKETISILRQDHFTKVDFEKIYNQHPDKLKFVESIEFSSCRLTNSDILTPGYINLKRLNLNLNQLTEFSQICQFKKL